MTDEHEYYDEPEDASDEEEKTGVDFTKVYDSIFGKTPFSETSKPKLGEYKSVHIPKFPAQIIFREETTVEETPAQESIHIEVEITVDTTIASDGHATFDPKTGKFVVTVPPYVEVVSVLTQAIEAHYHAGGRTIYPNICDFPDVFSLMIDDSSKPSCKWYSPSADEIASGSMQIDDYPFSVAHKEPSCSNPALTGNKNHHIPCQFVYRFNSCNYSDLTKWEDVMVGYEQDAPSLCVRRCFFANKMPYYELYDQSTDTILVTKTDDLETIRTMFEDLCAEKDMTIKALHGEKKSYFKTILV